MIVALAGGVGGAKLAQGLYLALPPETLTVVGNTADDMIHLGLRSSPDLDTVLYTLAGLANAAYRLGARGGLHPLSGRAVGGAQDGDATRRGHAREGRPVLAIVVADEVPRPLVAGRGLAQLLGDPGVGRVARHADMDDAPRAERDDEEGEQRTEAQVGDREEVARPAVGGVVAQEGGPRLPARARRAVAAPIGLARALRHADAQLAPFAAAALRTPARVRGRQPAEQRDRLRRERRAPRPRARLPSPARPEARAVPPQQRLRPDEEQGLPPGADPAREQHQERAIRRRHHRALDAPTRHEQLLAEHGVLGEQLRPAPHHIGPGTGCLRQRQRPRPEGCAARGVTRRRALEADGNTDR